MVYAQALVAWRHIRLIWNGFDEAKDFVECLCRALTCWSTGANAISLLTGKKAFEDCKRAASKKRCDDLQTNTVEEILALYDKICPRSDCTDENSDPDGEGCHHSHDHDHKHHHDHDCDHEHDDDDDDNEDEDRLRRPSGHSGYEGRGGDGRERHQYGH